MPETEFLHRLYEEGFPSLLQALAASFVAISSIIGKQEKSKPMELLQIINTYIDTFGTVSSRVKYMHALTPMPIFVP